SEYVDEVLFANLQSSDNKKGRFVEALAESPDKDKVGSWLFGLYRDEIQKDTPDWYLVNSYIIALGKLDYREATEEIRPLFHRSDLRNDIRRSAGKIYFEMSGDLTYQNELPYSDEEIISGLVNEAKDLD